MSPAPAPAPAGGPAGARRGAVPAGSPAGQDIWQRTVVGWDIAFWLMVAIGAVRVLAGDLDGGRRWIALGLLGVLGAAYLVFAQRVDAWTRRSVNPYLMVLVPVLGVLLYLDPNLGFLLFIAYPQVWAFCERTRVAVAFSVLVTLSAGTGFAAATGFDPDDVTGLSLSLGVSLLFSLLLGLWISGVVNQSQDRAELIHQLEATRSELAEVERAHGVVAERERLAREIHDTLAQGFTSIVMLSQAASAQLARDPDGVRVRLETIEDVARENLAEARALVAAFAPVALDGATLSDAVRRLVARFGTETGLEVRLEVDGEVSGLGRDREVVLLRVAQEALTNVRRHARASRVTVRLVADGGTARVEVGDDGVGFDPDTPASGDSGFGLAGMRGRVLQAGGDLDVTSAPGRGTRVTVRVPLPAGGLG